jgi:hypothetical protein
MNFESGAHAKLPTQRSKFGVRPRICPVLRSYSTNWKRSLSYPAVSCMRHAMYFPSGEYSGVESEPGELEIFFGVPPDTGTTKISLLVEVASTSSILLVNATSCPSGEKAYLSCPPRENGGAS